MKELSDVTCLVVDTGLFLPFAQRMAEECKTVIYWNPDKRGFPSLKQGSIGDGFENITHTLDFWPVLNQIDMACFPDIGNYGLQEHLREIGIPVWGSGRKEMLETKREHFMQVLADLNLEVPKFKVCVGIEALRDELRPRDECYVKISRWRGDMETTRWRSWAMDSVWLDWLAVTLGPLRNRMRFLVFDKIETDLEIGADTYCVDGQFPSLMLNGIEGKDKSYFAAVTPREEMPDQIQTVLNAIGSHLFIAGMPYSYRNQISFEVRVKGDKFYYNDATQRGGMPSSASQHKLWKNFPSIVWHGANGELIDPEPAAKFSIETMITCKSGDNCWDVVEIPDELEGWARFSNCCYVDGCYCFPPDELHSGDLGWLVAIGDTPQATLNRAKELADLLPDALNADVEALADVIKEIESAQEQGIPFTKAKMPEPAAVLE